MQTSQNGRVKYSRMSSSRAARQQDGKFVGGKRTHDAPWPSRSGSTLSGTRSRVQFRSGSPTTSPARRSVRRPLSPLVPVSCAQCVSLRCSSKLVLTGPRGFVETLPLACHTSLPHPPSLVPTLEATQTSPSVSHHSSLFPLTQVPVPFAGLTLTLIYLAHALSSTSFTWITDASLSSKPLRFTHWRFPRLLVPIRYRRRPTQFQQHSPPIAALPRLPNR